MFFYDFWNDDLAQLCGFVEFDGAPADNIEINALCFDSRAAKKNSLYFALPGLHTDGRLFIDDAVKRGASVVVHEGTIREHKEDVLYIKVKDARFAMSPISAAFYGNPSHKLITIGVTGTEGKSTTVYLIFQLLRAAGKKCGFISTVQYSLDGSERDNSEHQTTPEAPVIQERLAAMLKAGCGYAVIEASSHGLAKRTNRLGDARFNCGVFTNVTHEHLEFHKTFENYRSDKAELFREFTDFGVVNLCDVNAEYFIKAAGGKPVSGFAASPPPCPPPQAGGENSGGGGENRGGRGESSGGGGELAGVLRVLEIASTAEGNLYTVRDDSCGETFTVRDFLPGAFNAGNVLAALLVVSRLLNTSPAAIARLVPRLKPVRGRMTAVNCGQDFETLVDYAHTPSSFNTIFPPIRKRLMPGARIISVFGSAGERDTQKRPLQGSIADKWSDIIILTDEDPRGEEPLDILKEIAGGIKNKREGETLFLIPDRMAAIKKSFNLARKNDIVLLLGKGHENTIIYSTAGRTTIPWNEIEAAREALLQVRFV